MIEIVSENYPIDTTYFNRVVALIESELKISGDATIKIGEEDESHALNKQYRNKDYPTDVLTFPLNEALPDGIYLGDIFICHPVLARQAKEAGISEKEELTVLITHGLLHLVNYDHENDSGEMLQKQQELLDKIKENV